MHRTWLTALALVTLLSGCSLMGRVARVIGNAGSTPWVKMGQCEALVWETQSSIACPVSRKGSDTINMLVIPDRQRSQQDSIVRLGTNEQFGMEFVIHPNPNDNARLAGITATLTSNIDTENYLVPTVLNGHRR